MSDDTTTAGKPEKPLSILHLEDVPADAELVQAALESDAIPCEITWVKTRNEFENALRTNNYDLILSDYKLPDYDGITALRFVREHYPDTPFVFISGTMGEDAAIQSLTEGGTDYVLKQNLARLAPAIKRELIHAEARRKRRQAEEALRESEDKFKYVFEHASVGKSLTLPTGEISVNQAMCDMLGYSREEFKTRKWQEITHPDDIELSQNAMNALLAGEKESARFNKRYRHKNGSVVWSDISTALRRDKDGQPLYFMTTINDITERVQAEEAMRHAEKRCGTLIENAPDGIVFVSTDGKFTYASPNTYKLFGYDTDEMSQLDPNTLTHPDDLARVLTVLSGVIQNPSLVTTLQYRFRHKDGRWLWIESTFSNLIAEPSIQAIVINFRDITERKQAEDALRESEERFKAIANHAVSWESWFGPDGEYIWVNPRVEHFTGYSAQEIQALPDFVSTVIADEDRAMFIGRFQEAIRGSREDNFEFRYLHKNGTKRWLSASWQPIYDAHGNPLGTRSSGYDITERKEAEEALRDSQELFRVFMANTPAAAWITDRHGVITYANPGYSKMFSGGDPTGRNVFDIYPEPIAREYVANNEQVLLEDRVEEMVESGLRADGSPGSFLVYKFPLRSEDGGINIGGTAIDITERKRAEEQLQQHVEDLRVRNDALTRFNAVTVDRELRMIELKREVNELCLKLGEPPRHKIVAVPHASDAPPEDRE